MENEDVKKLVNAVGASAELVGILNKALLSAGFTKKDSLYLYHLLLSSQLNHY